MSLNLLSMSSADLRNEIYSFAEKHPALEIKSDSLESGVASSHTQIANNSRFSDNTHYGTASANGSAASDNFQAALESNADEREPLTDHLLHQLNSMNLSEDEKSLCEKLIYNLDEKGFHILAPISFLKPDEPNQTGAFLKKCLSIVQNLDPAGCCTNNFLESLSVQAKISGLAPNLALFLLESQEHFAFLNPPQPQKIQKKITDYIAAQKKLKFNPDGEIQLSKDDITIEEIELSLDFIRRLDPYPARNFGTAQSHFIAPDVIVTRNSALAQQNDLEESGHIQQDSNDDESPEFTVTFAREFLPKLQISKEYTSLINSTELMDGDTSEQAERKKAELKFARNSVNEAKVFIESVLYRESTILKAAQEIVAAQAEFFRKGARFLAPLRQKDIAEKLGVHEATISRMANSKYLSCEWGIFPISYFFTNAVSSTKTSIKEEKQDSAENGTVSGETSSASTQNAPISKESVKYEIAAILEEHKNDKKALSDQKISDILAAKGIKVARRTVAKYRTELNINSSYER